MALDGDLGMIEVRFRGMQQKLIGAIVLHEHELKEVVEASFERLIKDGSWEKIVDETLRRELADCVKNALAGWEVRNAIRDTMVAALNKESKG